MGYARWSYDDWNSYSSSTSKKATADIFKSSNMSNELNPLGVRVREARDSTLNPNSTPLIIGADVTGSMGILAENIVRTGLGTLFEEILTRKPITDPQIMTMAIGDAHYDKAPLQVSQFEADLKAASWLEKIYIEGGGGGNNIESYDLAYYFAAYHTSIDSYEKRGKRGFIFTLGDEEAPKFTTKSHVKKFIGDDIVDDIPFSAVLAEASKMYNCYHIMIGQGSHARSYGSSVKKSWTELMGQRAIWLEDYTKLAETIVSIIQVVSGEDKDVVAKSWNGSTSVVVANAIKDITAVDRYDNAKSVIRF